MEDQIIEQEYGTACLEPQRAVTAGTFVTWKITYQVGNLGMDDGSSLKIATNQTSDWGPPQFQKPNEDNYSTVSTDGCAEVEAEFDREGGIRPWKPAIKTRVYDGSLDKGESITLTLGKTGKGNFGIRAQSYVEEGFQFRVLVDPFGTGEYVQLPEVLTVDIVPGSPSRIKAFLPSQGRPGQELRLSVRSEDYWGNVTSESSKEIVAKEPGSAEIKAEGKLEDGTAVLPLSFERQGTHRLQVESPDLELTTTTNPVVIDDHSSDSIFWGDIHGQSVETVGTGTVREYFEFAKDRAFVDFASHAGNDFQITEELWGEIREQVRKFNEPGEFVTFLCYEWSANTSRGGDHNVYFLEDEADIHKSSSWQTKSDFHKHEGTHPVSKLYERYRGREDVMIIPHQGGRPAELDSFDDQLSPLVEILSTWGVFEWFGQEALEKGYRIGFAGGSDDHTGRPGATYPSNETGWNFNIKGGLLALRADDLNRESLWTALKSRNCYVTTGARIILDVSVGGQEMGGQVECTNPPTIQVNVHGTAPVQRVDLFRASDRISTVDVSEGEELLEFLWKGARSRNRNKVQDWSGGLALDRGRIRQAEGFGFDHPQQGITRTTDTALKWTSASSGNYQGVRLALDAPREAQISFVTEALNRRFKIRELDSHRVESEGDPEKKLEVRRTGEATKKDLQLELKADQIQAGVNPYYVRVMQSDGEMAWSSPIFVLFE